MLPQRHGRGRTLLTLPYLRTTAYQYFANRSDQNVVFMESSKGTTGSQTVRFTLISFRLPVDFPLILGTVIPDYAKMRWIVRAPSYDEMKALIDRVKACLEYAA